MNIYITEATACQATTNKAKIQSKCSHKDVKTTHKLYNFNKTHPEYYSSLCEAIELRPNAKIEP